MLHTRRSESKHSGSSIGAQLSRQSEHQLHPHLAHSAAGPGETAPAPLQRQFAQFQSAYGNQAVLRMLDHSGPALQAKLTVNQPGDRYEQEADRVADQVMRMPAPAAASGRLGFSAPANALQRKCEHCEEEDKKMQRQDSGAGPAVAPPIVSQVLSSPGAPLDAGTRAFMEPRFGQDFSHVRVHTDARAAESARAVNALAYTVGPNIVFRSGYYAPQTENGRRLVAHELAHALQQGSGDTGMRSAPGLLRQDDTESAVPDTIDTESANVVSPLKQGPAATASFDLDPPFCAMRRRLRPNFAINSGHATITVSLGWTGPARCRQIPAWVALARERFFLIPDDRWDHQVSPGSLQSSWTLNSLPADNDYYIEVTSTNDDSEHCCMTGNITVSA